MVARLPFELSGIKIIAARATVEIRRSWWERLFSWPWRPGRALKTLPNPVLPPIGMSYHDTKTGALIMHPQDYDQLRRVTRDISDTSG